MDMWCCRSLTRKQDYKQGFLRVHTTHFPFAKPARIRLSAHRCVRGMETENTRSESKSKLQLFVYPLAFMFVRWRQKEPFDCLLDKDLIF